VKRAKNGSNLFIRGGIVVIVGSRHIIEWTMDWEGKLYGEPHLIGEGSGEEHMYLSSWYRDYWKHGFLHSDTDAMEAACIF
jgi:hypothetical protein